MTDKFRTVFSKIDYGLLLAILIPLIGILPTFGEGLANGADAPFHAHRIYAMAELIQDGNLYPRWVSYFHMGYGYPVFNYYAPLATHIGAWFHLLGFDVVTAYNLTNALAWIVGSVGIYLLARTFLPVKVALVACVLWVYAPSRLYEFWWQGSLAQIVATSFIPYVFYGIIRTTRFPTLKNSLWIAIPFALIVLSHTPTTYMTAVFVAPFCFLAPLPIKAFREIFRRWIYIALGLGISAGLSAIFLIPVFAEVQYVRIAGELPETVPFLKAGFATLSEVFALPSLIDSTDATLVMPRTLGLVGRMLSIVGFFALVRRRKILLAVLLFTGFGFAIFLALEPSLDVWLLIPSFRNLRFPERLLRVGVVFVALLGASSLLWIPRRWHLAGSIVVSLIVIVQALPIMHPRDDDRVWENLSALDEIEMEFRENNWGTTAYDEYEPVWGEATRFDMPPDAESYIEHPYRIRFLESDYLQKADRISYEHMSDTEIRVSVTEDDLSIRLRQFYFPGWEVTLDGESFPIEIGERFGLMQLRLPEGEHILHIRYVGTPIQHSATLISIITVLGCVVIVSRGKSENSELLVQDETPLNIKIFGVLSLGLIVFSVVNVGLLQDAIFRIASPPDKPYYMEHPVNATFDDSVTLLGYTLDSDTVSPSNPLGIRLYWRVHSPVSATYRPVVQLVNLPVTESWAVSQPLDFEGGKLDALSPKQFMSDYHRLDLFEDVPPYVAKITVQLERVDADGTVKTSLDDGQDRVMLPDVIRVDVSSDTYIGEKSDIQFGEIVDLLCVGVGHDESNYNLDLWWQVMNPIPVDFKLFVHGLDDTGEIVTQSDVYPLAGNYPMSFWRDGQILRDRVLLPYDDAVMTIRLGLYNPADVVRLPVTSPDGQSDHINLSIKDATCQP